MSTEAQKKASREYSRKHRELFKVITLKLNREKDADIISALKEHGIQGYIKRLIRKDIGRDK